MKATDIRILRLDAGVVRQEAIAIELGWNRETMTDIERGRIGIDDETRQAILAAIGRIAARRGQPVNGSSAGI